MAMLISLRALDVAGAGTRGAFEPGEAELF